MQLISVYDNHHATAVTFDLLRERVPEMSISHREMPTWEEHVAFVASRPYEAWYLIEVPAFDECQPWTFIGAVYLTRDGEIGVFLFDIFRGRGLGTEAMHQLMARHPRERYLANINPRNGVSIAFFLSLGFHHIQNTYELRP